MRVERKSTDDPNWLTGIPLRDYLENIYIPPENDVVLNFLRNHDEFTLEKMSKEQKEAVFQKFAPEEFIRIFGRGIRRRLAPMLSENSHGMDRPRVAMVEGEERRFLECGPFDCASH